MMRMKVFSFFSPLLIFVEKEMKVGVYIYTLSLKKNDNLRDVYLCVSCGKSVQQSPPQDVNVGVVVKCNYSLMC
jgi:hypothetical protein